MQASNRRRRHLASRRGVFLNRFVDVQTPPVSLTLNHLPFQGRQGHFVPAGHKGGDAYNIIYKLFTHAIVVVLPEIRGYRRILSAPTGAAETMRLQQPTESTPSASLRSAAFNRGMIATGNHNFEKFAALCNTLSGEPRALRARGECVYLGAS